MVANNLSCSSVSTVKKVKTNLIPQTRGGRTTVTVEVWKTRMSKISLGKSREIVCFAQRWGGWEANLPSLTASARAANFQQIFSTKELVTLVQSANYTKHDVVYQLLALLLQFSHHTLFYVNFTLLWFVGPSACQILGPAERP